MVAGIAIGSAAPALVAAVAAAEMASVNLAVAVLIWVMAYPAMESANPGALKDVIGRRAWPTGSPSIN